MDSNNQQIYGLLKFVNKAKNTNWNNEIQFYKNIDAKELKLCNTMRLIWSVKGTNLKIDTEYLANVDVKETL